MHIARLDDSQAGIKIARRNINNLRYADIFFAPTDGEALYSQQKQDRKLTVSQIMNSLPNSD